MARYLEPSSVDDLNAREAEVTEQVTQKRNLDAEIGELERECDRERAKKNEEGRVEDWMVDSQHHGYGIHNGGAGGAARTLLLEDLCQRLELSAEASIGALPTAARASTEDPSADDIMRGASPDRSLGDHDIDIGGVDGVIDAFELALERSTLKQAELLQQMVGRIGDASAKPKSVGRSPEERPRPVEQEPLILPLGPREDHRAARGPGPGREDREADPLTDLEKAFLSDWQPHADSSPELVGGEFVADNDVVNLGRIYDDGCGLRQSRLHKM